jgi:hypothetical protein
MEQTLELTRRLLGELAHPIDFVDLVRLVAAQTGIDEASAKAAILRLLFEGEVSIDSEWSVRIVALKTNDVLDPVLQCDAA